MGGFMHVIVSCLLNVGRRGEESEESAEWPRYQHLVWAAERR
ncbi:hypothetical protein RR46_03273 [Papilio xuthus]|uniref:Uncharacterized protein n=1 Tax=Papilio xuthus TaxID=66420 RepID=A0A194QGN0_PAPXU|nr:hypothetical protein RR46_03273 [Papilio xuthus]